MSERTAQHIDDRQSVDNTNTNRVWMDELIKQYRDEESKREAAKLTPDEFSAVAKQAFKDVDFDRNGLVDVSELTRALSHSSRSDTSKTLAATRLMYDKYNFLERLTPHGIDQGISEAAINTAIGLAKGTINTNDVALSHKNRENYGLGGYAVGSFAGAVGGLLGTATLLRGAPLLAQLALEGVGMGAGMIVGGLAIGAIGYGFGRKLDYRDMKHSQSAEVNAFLKEFRR